MMVCLGNICRSPMAEGLMKHKAAENGLNWIVDSAGTSSWHSGEQPDRRAMATMKAHGIDISDQRSRQFRGYDLEEYDLIFAMDTHNHRDMVAHAKNESEKQKVHLMLNSIFPGEGVSVPDPYYDDNGFEEVYALLDRACDVVIKNNGA